MNLDKFQKPMVGAPKEKETEKNKRKFSGSPMQMGGKPG